MNKQSIRSLAAGIFAAATLMAIFTLFFQEDSTDHANQILKKEGMVAVTETELSSLQSSKAELEEENEYLKNEIASLKEISDETSDTNQNKEDTDSSKNTEKSKVEKTEAENVDFEIESGMSLEQIANSLESSKLVDDAAQFKQFMIDKGFEKTVQIGKYKLNKNMTYLEIAQIIAK